LNASMDEAGLRNAVRTSARNTILGGVVDSVKALVFKDEEDADDEASAHLNAEVTIKVDRYGRGEISQAKLDELAKLALEEDDGVRVVLTNGTILAGIAACSSSFGRLRSSSASQTLISRSESVWAGIPSLA
jgi:hypothetical protein